jgi:multiple antibiotic resistance protein
MAERASLHGGPLCRLRAGREAGENDPFTGARPARLSRSSPAPENALTCRRRATWSFSREPGATTILLYTETAFTCFIAFLVILDPPGTAVVFATLTRSMAQAQRRTAAWTATLLAGIILLVFALVGKMWLAALGIGLPAFRVAGGILLFLLATNMVFGRSTTARGPTDEETPRPDDITVFPLAFPLIAGPGAMTSVVLLMGRAANNAVQEVIVMAMLVAALAIVLLSLLQAGWVVRMLGISGSNVVGRVLGINLAALAVQFIVDGLHDVLVQWGLPVP